MMYTILMSCVGLGVCVSDDNIVLHSICEDR